MSISLSNHKVIGHGAYGRVYIGTHNNIPYAVKRRYILQGDDVPPGCVHVNEIDAMCRFKHPNLIHAISMQQNSPIPDNFRTTSQNPSGDQSDVRFRADLVYLVTDQCDGDLSELTVSKSGKIEVDNLPLLKSIMWQILSGIAYIHTNGFIHRDLKPANILYKKVSDDSYDIKICDFDMCIPVLPEFGTIKAMTPEYTPPEILIQDNNVIYHTINDIWGIGCTLYHLVTGNQIASRKGIEKKLIDTHILAVHHTHMPNGNNIKYDFTGIDMDAIRSMPINLDLGDDQTNDLLKHMLDCNKDTRYTAIQCMQHPFFSTIGQPIPTYSPPEDHTIEKHFITEDMANIFDNRLGTLTRNMYFGFFLGLDILMRVCSKKYKGDGSKLAICCFNLGMKYYYKESSVFDEIDDTSAKRVEYRIIAEILGGKLYRDTIYNHIGGKSSPIYRYLMAPDHILPCKFSSLLHAINKTLTE